jgi:hypothetical protein
MRVLHWRPCPFFCPIHPDYFRSWADMMTEAAKLRGQGVAIDVPESAPIPRGLHDLSGIYVEVTPDNGVHFHGDDAGSRCKR